MRLWDMHNRTAEPVVLRRHASAVWAVAFSSDGHWLASGSGDQAVRLWDMHNRTAEPVVLRGHEREVSAVAFSSDGRWLASGSRDQTVRLWDMHNRTAEPVVLRGMSERSGRSRSAAMGAGWPVAVGTRPCGCGTCTTVQPSPWCCGA